MFRLLDSHKSIFIILFFFVFHLFFINLETINFEHSFSESLFFIINYDINILSEYFINNANTLGFTLIGSFLFKIFPFIKPSIILKIISASGYLFLGFGIIKLYKNNIFKISLNKILIIIFLNPLIWTYGFRATPDFIAFSLGFYSIVYLTYSENIKYKILLSLIFGFALLIKFHVAFFYIFYFSQVFFFRKKSKHIKSLLINSFFMSIPLLLYVIIIYFQFNFFLTHPLYQTYHTTDVLNKVFDVKIDLSNLDNVNIKNTYSFFINFFIQYLGYCFLFFGIFVLFDNFKFFIREYNYLKIIFSLLLFYFALTNLTLVDYGELDFGSLTNSVPKNILILFFYTLSFFSFLCLIFLVKSLRNNKNDLIICSLIYLSIYIIFLSFFRPSQRYLIYLVPIFIFIYFYYCNYNKLSFWIYIISFSFVNLLILLNHMNTSNTVADISKYLAKNNLYEYTHPGTVNPHIRHKFFVSGFNYQTLMKQKKRIYIIDNIQKNNSIICYQRGYSFLLKKTCLNYR